MSLRPRKPPVFERLARTAGHAEDPSATSGRLDPVKSTTFNYLTLVVLSGLAEGLSLSEITARHHLPTRHASDALKAVDDAYWREFGFRLVDSSGGKNRTPRLTPAGSALVGRLKEQERLLAAAVGSASAAAGMVPVLCASNCLPYLVQLQDSLPDDTPFRVFPHISTTAEIRIEDVHHGGALCLGSTLMSSSQEPQVGRPLHWGNVAELLPLEVHPFRLLTVAGDALPPAGSVTVKTALEANLTFIIPDAGPAADFVDRCYPDWRALRPLQGVSVSDLDRGLRTVASGLVPRGAMVVHGLAENDPRLAQVRSDLGAKGKRLVFRDLDTGGHHQLVGVTGVFRAITEAPATLDNNGKDPYDLLWAVAQEIWSPTHIHVREGEIH